MNSPDQVVPGYGGRQVAQRKYAISGRQYLLRIVYEEGHDVNEIVTAYLTSDVRRYWKEETDAH
jgi:hypothetical protein